MVSRDPCRIPDLVGCGLPGGQHHLPEHRDTVRDLNYQLKQLCRHNRDGGYATQRNRDRLLLRLLSGGGVVELTGVLPFLAGFGEADLGVRAKTEGLLATIDAVFCRARACRRPG